MSSRTFKIDSPHQTGTDIAAWQQYLRDKFLLWDIDYPVAVDGDYGAGTRSATASMCRAWGIQSAEAVMADGVTADLRLKLRNNHRTDAEEKLFGSVERTAYRASLRDRYANKDISTPVGKILQDSWGWHPGVHDGIDLICPPSSPLLAIVSGRVIRADASGWWGLAAHASGGHPVSDGDGIIVIRATRNVGPFKVGMNFCYGHAEHAVVKAGERVTAGQHIGTAGFAVAWHVHFMVNDNNDARGVGDRDPRPFTDYARKNG